MKCGPQWVPPMAKRNEVTGAVRRSLGPVQTCILERGHEGDHRSLANVTAANKGPASALKYPRA